MITIKRFVFNPIGVNTYVLSDSTGEGVIIDCGCLTQSEWEELYGYITSRSLHIVHLLNTHFHLDHVFGNRFALQELGLKPEASSLEHPYYTQLQQQVAMFFGGAVASSLDYSFTHSVGPSLKEGDRVRFGQSHLDVIATPGHSPGGICFYNAEEQILISGDTLFESSVGRTDLAGGNYQSLLRSIKEKLSVLPDSTQVYPGHGGTTTIGHEKLYNPYL